LTISTSVQPTFLPINYLYFIHNNDNNKLVNKLNSKNIYIHFGHSHDIVTFFFICRSYSICRSISIECIQTGLVWVGCMYVVET